MYPSEFDAGDAGFVQVDAPLFLGLPPLLGLILLLAILLLAAGMFVLGRWQAGRSGGAEAERAPEEIYAVIRRHATEARAAGSHELRHRAEVLACKIDDYLGPVLVVGRDLANLTKALKTAQDGKIETAAKPPDPQPAATEPTSDNPGCGCGGPARGKACTCPPRPVSINQIYIGGAPAVGPEAPPTRPAEPVPPPPAKTDMTHRQQVDALDQAVRAFHDHWLNRDARIAELKAAQAALNRRPAARDLRGPHGSQARATHH